MDDTNIGQVYQVLIQSIQKPTKATEDVDFENVI